MQNFRFLRGNCRGLRERRGFNLIELLVVMGIIALLAGVGSVAFSSISSHRSIRHTGAEIADLFQSVRACAMAQNTEIEVVIFSNGEDLMVSVQTADGTALSRPRNFPNTRVGTLPYDSQTRPNAVSRIELAAGQEERFVFNRRGEMRRLAETPPTRSIELGLSRVAGGQPLHEKNYAAVQVQGLTGTVSLYQP